MQWIQQKYPDLPRIDLVRAVHQELAAIEKQLRPGQRVAVAVGSRGIQELETVVRTVVQHLRGIGTQPFILPAMGSHGGATPEGQTAVLAEYGITAESLGVPIEASVEVQQIGLTPENVDVHCSVEALKADAIVLVNRIKPHTDFVGNLGSGILKMLVIGLGKRTGATCFHIAATRFGYEPMLRSLAKVILQTAPILCGIGLIEDQRHQIVRIASLPAEKLEATEESLFQEAKRLMPKLPFDDIDLLIIDRIGKNISGAGMDPNVTGRGVQGYLSSLDQRNLPAPRIKRVFVRDLTPETHGNAIGIGFADITTTRAVKAIDLRVTYVNALTSLTPQSVKIPIHFDTDREALTRVLESLALDRVEDARVVRILDTLTLENAQVSENFAPLWKLRRDLVTFGSPCEMAFDASDNLLPIDNFRSNHRHV